MSDASNPTFGEALFEAAMSVADRDIGWQPDDLRKAIDGVLSDLVKGGFTGEYGDYAIWWLDSSATFLADVLGFHDSGAPEYIKNEFTARIGRAGRGRLWVPKGIAVNEIEWIDGDPRFDAVGEDCGGIVIRAEDVWHVFAWPGFVTDLELNIIGTLKSEAEHG